MMSTRRNLQRRIASLETRSADMPDWIVRKDIDPQKMEDDLVQGAVDGFLRVLKKYKVKVTNRNFVDKYDLKKLKSVAGILVSQARTDGL